MGMYYNIGFGNDFLNMTLIVQESKTKQSKQTNKKYLIRWNFKVNVIEIRILR